MRKYGITVFLSLAFSGFLTGQAVMSAPVLRTSPEEIRFTARFSDFKAGEDYRIGVGTVGEKIRDATIELVKDDTVLPNQVETFEQGFARSWFEVDKISVQGFVLPPSKLPAEGEALLLRVVVPRPEADRLKRMFVILARKYGPTRWYIEDGSELNDTLW
ncbi:MAG: hypothetical protein V3T61_03695 [Acidobacteriota bacterium]